MIDDGDDGDDGDGTNNGAMITPTMPTITPRCRGDSRIARDERDDADDANDHAMM